MGIKERQQGIIQEFARYADWSERYKHIIELGKGLPGLLPEYKNEKNRIKGCQSQTWLHATLKGRCVNYEADSDALIVKGLAALLISVFSGHEPEEIVNTGVDFLQEIGLTSHLSQSRANGMAAMVKQFKNYAVAFNVLQRQGL